MKEGSFSKHNNNLVRTCILVHQAMKIPDATAAADKEWEKHEKLPAWQSTTVKQEQEVILEAQREKKESPLSFIDGDLPSHKL